MTERHVQAEEPAAATRAADFPGMPVEFGAFCELHRPRYLSYARVWFADPDQAAAVVRHALGCLASVWSEVLVGPNPTAAAWEILRTTIAEQRAGSTPSGLRPGPADEDLAILHYVVGLATPEIADVIGTDTASITGRLRHARRSSPVEEV
ncbi:hypothetical protein AB0K43_15595 [Kitasatospora sp. NPDC049258]|uniref:hypothetical protein n=1 Tax=Kitasatospora sp. NPDC049258 TaxID=3155394 RepID=UPI003428C7E0